MSERERFEAAFPEAWSSWNEATQQYLGAVWPTAWAVWQVARSGQSASGSSQGARSDVKNGVGVGQPEAPTVTVLAWKLRRAAEILDRDGDEHGIAADLWSMLADNGTPAEAPTAAPLTDEQATAFLLELRAVVAETMKRPGEAVPIPARVRTEVAKFMRDQPSVFDRLPYGEVVALAEFCGGVVAHPPARSGAKPAAERTEQEIIRDAVASVRLFRQDYCPEKIKPGGCTLHNLHCGYPKCNEPPTARSGAGSEEGQG